MTDRKIGPLPWVNANTRTAVPVLVLPAKLAPDGWQFPIIARVETETSQAWAWVWRDVDVRDGDGKPLSLPADRLGLTESLRKVLLEGDRGPADVWACFPESSSLIVKPTATADITERAVVHVARTSPHAPPERRLGRRAHWRLLVFDGICAPVQVRTHNGREDSVRCGMQLRTLIGAKPDDSVYLGALTPAELRQYARTVRRRVAVKSRKSRLRRASSATRRLLQRGLRYCDFAVERVLRVLLRAPTVVLRATQAPIGDDASRLIRLHPSLFESLGAKPGGQVLVTWCGLSAAALALEDHEKYEEEKAEYVKARQATGKTSTPFPTELPEHLVARISATSRRDLGIPGQTVVEVRRRLRPMVVSQLNQLAMPVAGIFLAGVAVESLRGWPLAVGLAIAIVFGIAPLRRTKPPEGLWP